MNDKFSFEELDKYLRERVAAGCSHARVVKDMINAFWFKSMEHRKQMINHVKKLIKERDEKHNE